MAVPKPSADRSTFEETRSQKIRSKVDDLVDSLPPEILIQISEYLDPADIVRSQRVSKLWRTIFSSEAVIRHALRRSLVFLGLDGKNVSTNDAMTYSRWHHGRQSGRPVKKVFLPCSDPLGNILNSCDYYLYHSRRLVHGVFVSNEVEMLALETGDRSI
ncbi:hypothetical protein VTN49DRAFT_1659 [Thermomyces lanuginosus]|uniref:uncharacterized protein n=1 Tax=Thermomyces lanuginosus TaxID=5541 RepID=UPI0037441508